MGDKPTTTQDTEKVSEEPKSAASEEEKGTQTQPSARTYTQAEVDAITAKVGRGIRTELQAVSTERENLNSNLAKVNTEILQARQQIEELNAQIEELSKDDPDKTDLVKLRREARAKLSALAPREAQVAERESKLAVRDRDELAYEVADGFLKADGSELEPTDKDAYVAATGRYSVKDRAGLEAFAEEKGWKVRGALLELPQAPEPGKTKGGTMQFKGSAAVEEGLRRDRQKR